MNDNHDKQRLISAYNAMMDQVRHGLSQLGRQTRPALTRLVDAAKEKIIELEELSREEAESIANYLERDIHDAAEYMASDTARDLADWLKFDIRLIEDRLIELFGSVADPTQLELLSLEERARHGEEYHTGEITAIGTLHCIACGQALHFHETGHIPPCPKCGKTRFTRDMNISAGA